MNLIAVTIDYETWHPVPAGKRIDWEKDVIEPTSKLLDLFDQAGVQLTLMAEMGEYFWLRERMPETADRMESQWIDTVLRGHDVQLHLHPCWLPELGADFRHGGWIWDWSKSKASDYPGDLTSLILRCKETLKSVITPAFPNYVVTSYRAGAYQAQPFKRLHDALSANEIFCDTSVYAGGVSAERGYDYTFAVSDHQPYFANAYDPQLNAPPGERQVIELPIFTFRAGQRWFMDNAEGKMIANRLLRYLSNQDREVTRRIKQRVSKELKLKQEYFVMIGHSKSELHFPEIRQNLEGLKRDGRFQFVTLSEMARSARRDLEEALRESPKTGGKQGNTCTFQEAFESALYNSLVPLDRMSLLRLYSQASGSVPVKSHFFPWTTETRIELPSVLGENDAMHGDLLSVTSGKFDCVIFQDGLDEISELDFFLATIHQVLTNGGVFISPIFSIASSNCHAEARKTWRMAPHEIQMRLENAGFQCIEVKPIQEKKRKRLTLNWRNDRALTIVRGWKRSSGATCRLDRALEAMDWVYRSLLPEKSSEGNDPIEIVRKGYAFCWGYAVVLGKLLQREGYAVRWLTMLAKDHPRGRGKDRCDSHEVIVVDLEDRQVILDAMANTCIPYSFDKVFRKPALAVPKKTPDQRYIERGYELYDTEAWYARVFKYALRTDVNQRILFWKYLTLPRTKLQTKEQ